MLFKMSEKGRVSKVLQPRGVVGHDVGVAREVSGLMTVAVEALVHARDVAQGGRRPFRGDRALLDATDGWGVVNPGSNGRVLHVSVLCLDGQLSDHAGVL